MRGGGTKSLQEAGMLETFSADGHGLRVGPGPESDVDLHGGVIAEASGLSEFWHDQITDGAVVSHACEGVLVKMWSIVFKVMDSEM